MSSALNPQPYCFSGYCWPLDKAHVVVMGAPLEETVSFRPGTRFGPRAIREASAYIEFWSPRARLDVDKARFYDAGDALTEQPLDKALDAIELAFRSLLQHGKPVVMLGGEHTLTLAVARALQGEGKTPCLLILDAHLDMRSEYAGRRLSHATHVRHIASLIGGTKLLIIGARAFTEEEIDIAKKLGVEVVEAYELPDYTELSSWAEDKVRELIENSGCKHLHISVDMDVFDPGYAPGVSNPEPEGLTPRQGLDIVFYSALTALRRGCTISLDVVEVAPPYDCGGITSVLAAKTVVEFTAAALAASK